MRASSAPTPCTCVRACAAGSGQQSYVTRVTCPGASSVVSSATLLAATGQQVSASAAVTRNCFELGVRLAEVGEPVLGR
jgi:hypothetical protein